MALLCGNETGGLTIAYYLSRLCWLTITDIRPVAIDPTMLEHREKKAGVVQERSSAAGGLQTQRAFTGESDPHIIGTAYQSISEAAQVLPVGSDEESGSISAADDMLQHYKPSVQVQTINIPTSSAPIRAIGSSKQSKKLPNQDLDEDLVPEGAESHDASEVSKYAETFQRSFTSTAVQPMRSDCSPEAGRPSGAIETTDLTSPGLHYSVDLVSRCITDDWPRTDCFQLCIGRNNLIPRWVPGSELPFYVDASSFLTGDDASDATTAIVTAAAEWNRLGDKVPYFNQVDTPGAAVFQLKYAEKSNSKNGETAFAGAFFPGDMPPTVYVYALSFKSTYRDYLANIFCHELGHILGARHSFAPEGERSIPCRILGERNPATVMQYPDHPSKLAIQESDAREMRMFYDLELSHYPGCPIQDYSPQKLSQVSQHAKQPGDMDGRSGARLASHGKVRMSAAVTTKSTFSSFTRAVLILAFFTMGLWVGSSTRVPVTPFCSVCKELFRHLDMVL